MTTSTQRQNRRGTSTQCDAMTPAAGEVIVDTTNNRTRVGDALKAGGWHQPNHADIQNSAFIYAVAGGTGNALTLTLSPAPAAYAAGMQIRFKAAANNTGSATINVNGLGAITFKKNLSGSLSNLSSGDIASGVIYTAVYDGTNFQIKLDVAPGLTSVSQGNLNTSLGSVAANPGGGGSSNWLFDDAGLIGTLPGGEYAFGFECKGASGTQFWAFMGNSSTSYARKVYGVVGATGGTTITVQERYVTASPPFDLGDGPVGGFIFARVNKAGEIIGFYIADVPPWAYNGKTRITPDYICPVKGTKYRSVKRERSLREIIEGAPLEFELQEITHQIKNADMHDIPHPFQGLESPDETIVLINPMDERLDRIMRHHNTGGHDEVQAALLSGKIYVDNEYMKRKGPPGVPIAPLRFKYSG